VEPPQAFPDPTTPNPQAWCSRMLGWFSGKIPVWTVQMPPHLKVLAQVRFVTVEHAGTTSRYQVNPRCLAAFPTAANVVMGRRPAS
jgi:hypothetical protein